MASFLPASVAEIVSEINACATNDFTPDYASMNTRVWISAVGLASAGMMALAHSNATGDVEKRMTAMSAMQKQIKALAPMMRGLSDYDAAAVKTAADVIVAHSGDALTVLFPEGSNAPPSEALDTIWEDWAGFDALADALTVAAEDMRRAADNGLGDGGTGQGSGMLAGDASNANPDAEALADMPVDASFLAMTKVCSNCHTKFRAKRF